MKTLITILIAIGFLGQAYAETKYACVATYNIHKSRDTGYSQTNTNERMYVNSLGLNLLNTCEDALVQVPGNSTSDIAAWMSKTEITLLSVKCEDLQSHKILRMNEDCTLKQNCLK